MITLLTLLAAGYTFLVRAEMESTSAVVNDTQLRHAAESGIQRAILELRNSKGDLDAWHDNPTVFRSGLVHGLDDSAGSQSQNSFRQATGIKAFGEKQPDQPADGSVGSSKGGSLKPAWRFNLVAPNFDDPSRPRYGLTDECSKLDINRANPEALRRFFQSALTVTADTSGNLNVNIDELVDSLLDWKTYGAAARPDGAKDEWYLANRKPGYRCKNGPFDSVDELLLVRGFSARILYGEDANRNGLLDANEDDGEANFPPDNADGILDRGIAPYLTVWAREYDTASDNKPRININNKDLDLLEKQLADVDNISSTVKDYILSRRRLGHGLGDPLDLITAPPEPELEEAADPLKDANTQSSQPGGQQDAKNTGPLNDARTGDADTGGQKEPKDSAGSSVDPKESQTTPADGGNDTKADEKPEDKTGDKSDGKGKQIKPDGSPDADNGGGQPEPSGGSAGQRQPGGRGQRTGGQRQGSDNSDFGVGRPNRNRGQQSGAAPGSQGGRTGQSASSQASTGPGTLDDLAGILDHLTNRPIPIQVGRINISTAPKPVLMSLTELSEEQVDQLISVRATLDGETRATPAWLVTQGIVRFSQLKAMLPKITTKSATFAVESVGYADHLDAFKRLYVILEMRGPVGQILYYRDLTPLGPAYHPRGEDTRGPKNQKSQ